MPMVGCFPLQSILPINAFVTLLVLERFFSRKERAKLFRSWAGSASMWIKVCSISLLPPHCTDQISQGGNAIWGNHTHAPDDPANCTASHGQFLSFRPSEILGQNANNADDRDKSIASDTANLTSEDAGTWILQHTPVTFQVSFTNAPYWGC